MLLLVEQCLNGLQFGLLLFQLAAGLARRHSRSSCFSISW
jgi:hypothetical protein